MKKFLFLLFCAATAAARAEEIALPDGQVLHRARVAKFYAGEFAIEHDGGIAHIPWAAMAENYRMQYPLDPAKATAEQESAQRIKAENLKTAEADQAAILAERSLRVTPTPAPSSVVTSGQILTRQNLASPAPTSAPRSQFGTVLDTPRNNLKTAADLKIGMRADDVLQILGNPLRVNGNQWVYGGGYIYIRDGKLDAMQNKSGGVFDAAWKR